ncbi:hypothetical protein HHI36_000098 [Cryptolaemus montrouzieri]|uniref:Vacuolar ATPase assembly protein VMA22 n=1 Tax=Cryptolaemus montrouzieri TaxID=559131 RepID=A0ABD2P3L1_9CUCU
MNTDQYEEVCDLLDKICLDTLVLMEEEIQMNINLEKSMCEGEMNLAKCRYIMGPNSVSALNIPASPEENIDSLVSVTNSPSETIPNVKEYHLNSLDSNKEKFANPIRWFSVLAPQNLFTSQAMYKAALRWVVQMVNARNQLNELCDKFESLKLVKASLKKSIQ